jgi:small-conductance mechanosensitive channel
LAFFTSLWLDPIARIILLAVLTALSMYSARNLTLSILQRVFKGSQFKYDEALFGVIQAFAFAYILIIFSAILILSFQKELGIASPDTIVLVYVFIGGIFTGALGYTSRESLENLFSGIMLRVNRPFSVGDRIILPSGEICDVREIGMEGVRLYNVLLNAEIYMSNTAITAISVTNVSRPDLELRLQVSVSIKAEKGSLADAETNLIQCAYDEPEVDQMLINDDEIKDRPDVVEFYKNTNRKSVQILVDELCRTYPEIQEVRVLKGAGASWQVDLFNKVVEEALVEMLNARNAYKNAKESDNKKEITDAIANVIGSWDKLANAVHSVGEKLPDFKDDLIPLITEMSKEPSVHSNFKTSDNDTYILVTLNVFAIHLERRFEVEHKLNKAILDKLKERGLLFEDEAKYPQSIPEPQ